MAKYVDTYEIDGEVRDYEREEIYVVETDRMQGYRSYDRAVLSLWSDYMHYLTEINTGNMTADTLVRTWHKLNLDGEIENFGTIRAVEMYELEDSAPRG